MTSLALVVDHQPEEIRYSVKTAADRLGVPPRTVRRWLHEHRLKGELTVAGWEVAESSIAAYLATHPGRPVGVTQRSAVDQPAGLANTAELTSVLKDIAADTHALLAEVRGLRIDQGSASRQKALAPAKGGHWWNAVLGSKA